MREGKEEGKEMEEEGERWRGREGRREGRKVERDRETEGGKEKRNQGKRDIFDTILFHFSAFL